MASAVVAPAPGDFDQPFGRHGTSKHGAAGGLSGWRSSPVAVEALVLHTEKAEKRIRNMSIDMERLMYTCTHCHKSATLRCAEGTHVH